MKSQLRCYEASLRLTEKLVCASLHGATRRFIETARLLLHIREANASFLLAPRPKVFYTKPKKAVGYII